MPIRFETHESGQYFLARYEGSIYDAELIPSYEEFYSELEKKEDLHIGIYELADLTAADLSLVTQNGITELSSWTDTFLRSHEITEKRVAILLLQEETRVPALMYEFWAKGSPELVRIFHNLDEAISWLTE